MYAELQEADVVQTYHIFLNSSFSPCCHIFSLKERPCSYAHKFRKAQFRSFLFLSNVICQVFVSYALKVYCFHVHQFSNLQTTCVADFDIFVVTEIVFYIDIMRVMAAENINLQ